MVEEAQIKGICFRSFLQAADQIRGSGASDAILYRLQHDVRSHYRSGAIVVGGWYPANWYASLHDAAQEVAGGGSGFAREIGKVTTEQDINTVFRFVLGLMSPLLLFRHADKILGAYCKGLRIEESCFEEGRIQLTLRGRSITPLIWDEWLGGAIYLLGQARAKGASGQRTGGTRVEDGRTKFDLRWRP